MLFGKLNDIASKNKKLYAEAAIEPAIDNIESSVQDIDDITDDTDDYNEPDMTTDDNVDEGANDYDDNTFNFDDPTLDDDADDTDTDYNDSDNENMFDENDDTESAQFKRKIKLLNRAYKNLYDKYDMVVTKLKEKDIAGDRGVVLRKFIDEYTELLNTLRDYLSSNDDEFVVRFQVFVEFRAAFVAVNNKLNSVEKDTALLS